MNICELIENNNNINNNTHVNLNEQSVSADKENIDAASLLLSQAQKKELENKEDIESKQLRQTSQTVEKNECLDNLEHAEVVEYDTDSDQQQSSVLMDTQSSESDAQSSALNSNEENIDLNKMMMFLHSSSESNNNSDTNSNTNSNSDYSNYNNYSSSTSGSSENTNSYSSGGENNNSIDFVSSSSGCEDELNFDKISPLEKLFALCDNSTPSNLESASKYIVPAFEYATTQEDFMRIFSYLRKYCFYSDVLLRSLWLEQLQNVIQYIHQEGHNIPVEFTENFNITNDIGLLISDLMHEISYQVKKYATASLLCIIEKQLLNNDQIEKIIIPSLLKLIKENNEDFHIDCISLFGKMAPLIGRDLTVKYILEPFCRLCSSSVFHTRKACASNLTEIANVISSDEVEKYLLSYFCEFAKDQVWAIRKVCADTFSVFALKCTRKTRELVLTDHFIRLIDDNSRWVKISAYKSLGSFIATFSRCNENDTHQETSTFQHEENDKIRNGSSKNDNSTEQTTSQNEQTKLNQDGVEYSNFIYWRNSLPTLEDNSKEANSENADSNAKKSDNNQILASNTDSNSNEQQQPLINQYGNLNSTSLFSGFTNSLYSSTNSLTTLSTTTQQSNLKTNDSNNFDEELKQDIVPPVLLGYFVTMVEMNAQQSLDAEMNYNCAFNFPAIALTLGLSNWKYVKNLYKKLCEDNNWKVRQTLAYSIHELAIILGTECTQNELVPIFDSFITDVDEIRMGIVANLSKFLRILSTDYRNSYMPKLNDFLKMDNQRNWRFRNELALQIAEFCELFSTEYIADYIQPVTFILALDKIAEVRLTALKALTNIMKQFELKNDQNYRRNFVDDIMRTFANNEKWSFRQSFVFLCENILKENAYSNIETFSNEFLSKLFLYREDKVPNIRVSLARVISNHIINLEYFKNNQNPLVYELETTLEYLRSDKENDVRIFFSSSSEEQTHLPLYEEALSMKAIDKENIQNEAITQTQADISNLNEYKITKTNISNLNDSLNLINNQMNYDDETDNGDQNEDEEDEDDDEIIETTKVSQLKIVNMDDGMEDESDEIIDISNSPITSPKKENETQQMLLIKNPEMEKTKSSFLSNHLNQSLIKTGENLTENTG